MAAGIVACSTGSAGPAGPSGAKGASGSKGNSGNQGNPGTAGSGGAAGASGPSNTTLIHTTIATPAGTDLTTAATVDAGTWGPFNLSGFCYQNAAGACAYYQIRSTDPTALLTDYETQDNNTAFPPDAGYLPIEYQACSDTQGTPAMAGPYDGTFAAQSTDGKTYITGALTTGVYLGRALPDGGPACQFAGYVTQSP